MAKRRDSLPPPENPAYVRLVVSAETRDRLSEIAWEHGYTIASLMRLIAEDLIRDPDRHLEKIPINPNRTP